MKDIAQPGSISPVVQAILSGNVSPDLVEKMLDAQAKHDAMQARKAFNEAMPHVMSEMRPAKKTGRNDHLRYNYATLDDCMSAVQSPLIKNGFSLSFKQHQEGDTVAVTATVTHAMGHSESTSLSATVQPQKGTNSLQDLGRTISYLKRFTLCALLGLSTEDTDGELQIAMIDHDDMARLEAACVEAGRDFVKYRQYQKQKLGETNGVLNIRKSDLQAAIKQIKK